MSAVSDFFEPERPAARRTARQTDERIARDPGPTPRTFADVLNGFSIGSKPAFGDPADSTTRSPDDFAGDTATIGNPVSSDEAGTERSVSDAAADDESFVRPYSWTGGRTTSEDELRVESLVSTTGLVGDEATMSVVEYRLITRLCRRPKPVVEVASELAVPLRVATVVLGDMVEMGLVMVHRVAQDDGSASHLALMERVLSGLRRL